MHITLSPQYRNDTLAISRQGDVLTVDGDPLDFSTLPDGGTLPSEAIDNKWVLGPVHRIDGVIHITLLWPYQRSGHVVTPNPIINPPDGPVVLPTLTQEDVHAD